MTWDYKRELAGWHTECEDYYLYGKEAHKDVVKAFVLISFTSSKAQDSNVLYIIYFMLKLILNQIWGRGYMTERCTNSLLKKSLNFHLFNFFFLVTKKSQKKCLLFLGDKIWVLPLSCKLCLCLGKSKCLCCAVIHWGIMNDRNWRLNFYRIKHGEYALILTYSITSETRWKCRGFGVLEEFIAINHFFSVCQNCKVLENGHL